MENAVTTVVNCSSTSVDHFNQGYCSRSYCWFIHPSKIGQRNQARMLTYRPLQNGNRNWKKNIYNSQNNHFTQNLDSDVYGSYRNHTNNFQNPQINHSYEKYNQNAIFLGNQQSPMDMLWMVTELKGRMERLETEYMNIWPRI